MARGEGKVTNPEFEQLLDYIGGITESALESNSRTDMRETLEEISDLTDSDSALIFNSDGTVEVESNEADSEDGDPDNEA
jgi:hypothetical protein